MVNSTLPSCNQTEYFAGFPLVKAHTAGQVSNILRDAINCISVHPKCISELRHTYPWHKQSYTTSQSTHILLDTAKWVPSVVVSLLAINYCNLCHSHRRRLSYGMVVLESWCLVTVGKYHGAKYRSCIVMLKPYTLSSVLVSVNSGTCKVQRCTCHCPYVCAHISHPLTRIKLTSNPGRACTWVRA